MAFHLAQLAQFEVVFVDPQDSARVGSMGYAPRVADFGM
jgi:hypothetical protein